MARLAGTGNDAKILVIEDNPADVLLLRRVLRGANRSVQLRVAATAEIGLSVLRDKGLDAAYIPDLILTDLNLPKMHGIDFLTAVKTDAALRHIPVLVLSGSSARSDAAKCLECGADGYFTKPLEWSGHDGLLDAVDAKLDDLSAPLIMRGAANGTAR